MEKLKIIDTKSSFAEENMQIDSDLLDRLDPNGDPILHLYRWKRPSFTYGYFFKLEDWIDLSKAKEKGFDFAKRPTGGGLLFHLWDLAFSFLMPANHPRFSQNRLENYRFVHEAVLKAVEDLFSLEKMELIPFDFSHDEKSTLQFCMARPTQYDLILGEKKIAGAAQRQKKNGYLHQGTISLAMPDFDLLEKIFLDGEKIIEAMKVHTFAPLGKNLDPLFLEKEKKRLEAFLALRLQEALEV